MGEIQALLGLCACHWLRLEIVTELDGGGAMAGLLLTPVEEGVSVGFAVPIGEMERERERWI